MRNYTRRLEQRRQFITIHTTHTKILIIESRNNLFTTSITNQTKLTNPDKHKKSFNSRFKLTERQNSDAAISERKRHSFALQYYNLDYSSSSTSIHNVTAKRFSYAMCAVYDETVHYILNQFTTVEIQVSLFKELFLILDS